MGKLINPGEFIGWKSTIPTEHKISVSVTALINPSSYSPDYRASRKLSKNNIRSHWTNKFTPAKSIFVSNSKLITWIQKDLKDIHPFKDQPDYLKPVVDKYPIQILAGESTKPEHIDFVIRVVVALKISKNASLKIELLEDILNQIMNK